MNVIKRLWTEQNDIKRLEELADSLPPSMFRDQAAITRIIEVAHTVEKLRHALGKAVAWEGRLNEAAQLLDQGHHDDWVDRCTSVRLEIEEAKKLLEEVSDG